METGLRGSRVANILLRPSEVKVEELALMLLGFVLVKKVGLALAFLIDEDHRVGKRLKIDLETLSQVVDWYLFYCLGSMLVETDVI